MGKIIIRTNNYELGVICMRKFVIAGVQMAVKPNDVYYNVDKAVKWLAKAVEECHADMVVFPETITTGFATGLSPGELYDLVDTIPGCLTERISEAARKLGVYVVFTSYERGESRGKVYNSAALIDHNGEIVGVYRKTHPYSLENVNRGGWVTPGMDTPVFSTQLGKIGIIICYDGDFPELSRALAVKGAEIIVRPSALLRSYEIWSLTNRARAYDNHVYVVGINAVGADAAGNYYMGNSMVVTPIAQCIAQGRGAEEIVYAELATDPLKYITYGSKSPQVFDHLEDRNLEVYSDAFKPAKSAFEPSMRVPFIKRD